MNRLKNYGMIVVVLAMFAGLATSATSATATHTSTAKAQSALSLKRTKAEPSWARWQYKLTFTSTKIASSVKLTWKTPSGLRVSGTGIKHGARTLKNVRAGKTISVVFWAWSSAAKKLCFAIKASTGQTARACNPNPGQPGSGSGVLDHFGVRCYPQPSDGSNNCLNNGVVNLVTELDVGCGSCYDYGNGFPMQVTLFPTSGFSFNEPQAAGFAAKVKIQPGPDSPRPTKADKRWHWAKVKGQRVPVWLFGHLDSETLAWWDYTITVPAGTAQVCVKVVGLSVWAAPPETDTECFTDPSVSSP